MFYKLGIKPNRQEPKSLFQVATKFLFYREFTFNWHLVKKSEKVSCFYEKLANFTNSVHCLTFVCYLSPSGNLYTMLSWLYLLQIIKHEMITPKKALALYRQVIQ